ncbi:PilZ domain-containing protein [Metabacillus sp. GX 13764]|uniref:PilZ domain-containing protein n=1 Tax=Metabacillus kandeliae TaxID=2900151 RepID=UPI001E4610C4|nr:PilZ domain-containing protein [Metabacillus kandeliae]MCD7034240.1 PilZ domain-containing protein [Metabacillus kandeliae]
MEYILLTAKDGRRITAGLASIDGELMNVVVKDVTGLNLGDPLLCQYENFTFQAHILKIDAFNLYLYVPLQEEKAPNERRRFPRHPCHLKGSLYIGEKQEEITLIDISLMGFGFLTEKPLEIERTYQLKLEEKDFQETSVKISLQNEKKLPANLYRYGSEIRYINDGELLLLKRYLIHHQLRA